MSEEVAIKVENLSKSFKLPHEKANSIKNALINFTKNKKGYEIQEVLDDVSFEVKKGDFFGIVGRNGSGKSTLLKLIAGTYTPTKGRIIINGKLTPFIELGVGFNPELTGRENVFLNGSLLGFNRKEMNAMYDDIVSFAEIERFMDQKLKNYSSGMQVRLAFSIAIRADTSILLLDEVLAVGDEAFQKKCSDFFGEIRRDKKRTTILVTHDMDSVRRYCNKALMLEAGKIIKIGKPSVVADEYSKLFISEQDTNIKNVKRKHYGTGEVVFKNIKYKLDKEKLALDFDIVNKTINTYKDVSIGIDFCINDEIIAGLDTLYLKDYEKGIMLFAGKTRHLNLEFPNNLGNHKFKLDMNLEIGLGERTTDHVDVGIFQSNNTRYNPVFKIMLWPQTTIK